MLPNLGVFMRTVVLRSRCVSSSALPPGAKPGVSGSTTAALWKMLWRHVHPDLFMGHEAARRGNERGMQQLSAWREALEESGGGDDYGRAAMCEIELHVHREEGESGWPLEKIRVVLPSPTTVRGNRNRKERALHQGLRKILSACGVPSDDLSQSEEAREERFRGQSLEEFLRDAIEEVKGGADTRKEGAVALAAARAALHLGRNITIRFADGMEQLKLSEQAYMGSALARALDASGNQFCSNVTIGISDVKGGVDSRGIIWINDYYSRKENGELCLQKLGSQLNEMNVASALERRRVTSEKRNMEADAALAMGIASISMQQGLDEAKYILFLKSIIEYAVPDSSVDLSCVPLIVVEEGHGFEIEDGFAMLPINVDVRDIASHFNRSLISDVEVFWRKREEDRKRAERLRMQAKHRLKLRKLVISKEVSDRQASEGCLTLLENASKLEAFSGEE